MKPLFNADNAEEYFTSLCVSYRDTANNIFNRDNEGRHASKHIYSAEYQKYVGMQIAMREVLEYFSKFELAAPNPQTNADRIRAMSDEELCDLLMLVPEVPCEKIGYPNCSCKCKECVMNWLQQPAEEV